MRLLTESQYQQLIDTLEAGFDERGETESLEMLSSLKPCEPVAWMVDKVNDRQFVYDERMLKHLDPDLLPLSIPLYAIYAAVPEAVRKDVDFSRCDSNAPKEPT